MAQYGRPSSIASPWWDPTGRRFTQPRRKRSPSKREQSVRDGLKGRFEFPATKRNARVSRHLVADLLADSLSRRDLDVVLLLTNELVTNAIVHVGQNFELGVRMVSGFVEVEVADIDRRVPTRQAPTTTAGWGRGMTIVESLAQDWGVTRNEGGKVVWFRFAPKFPINGALDRPAAPPEEIPVGPARGVERPSHLP
jgi:anti-sigma regulatory factor (Ser/Thr protein kinase)